MDKYDSIKQCKKNREESASRLTATCDLLTAHCKFNDSLNINIQVVLRKVVLRHALLYSRQLELYFIILFEGKKSILISSRKGKLINNLKFSVLSMKIPNFYDVRLCRFVNRYRQFGEFTGSNLRGFQEDVTTQDTYINCYRRYQ